MPAEPDVATAYPAPPCGAHFASLYQALTTFQPLLTGWCYDDHDGQVQVNFRFGAGFTGQIAVVGDEFVIEVYAGKCPLEAGALKQLLHHATPLGWLTRGVSVERGVLVFLSGRYPLKDLPHDLPWIIVAGMEIAMQERSRLDIWWSRTGWASGRTQA